MLKNVCGSTLLEYALFSVCKCVIAMVKVRMSLQYFHLVLMYVTLLDPDHSEFSSSLWGNHCPYPIIWLRGTCSQLHRMQQGTAA